MVRRTEHLMKVEAELQAPVATAQLVRFQFDEPIDSITVRPDSYVLDLCLTPRPGNARACYTERWNSARFEQMGNLFIQPAGEPMRAKSDGCCEQSSIICLLDQKVLNEWFDGGLDWSDNKLLAGLDIRDGNIQSLLLRLVQEARQPGFASDMLVEMIAGQLAIELTRYCTESNDGSRLGGLAAWRLRVIEERVREIKEPPTLSELADLCKISVRQLTRGFRVSRGCSVGDYVANARVEHAKQLLATTESVKSIAYSLGFSSPSSFCYAFRRAAGETPGQYRQRLFQAH